MTTRVNLLPWREMRRREHDRRVLSLSVGTWILMGLVVFYAQWHMSGLIDHQKKRNNYLKTEISKLDKQIKEINRIKKRKAALLARMEVIQRLQRDRTQVVHIFDDLVRKLPKGVYLTSLKKVNRVITLNGFAQSNARISALMQNLDSSDWFTNPDLDVITIKGRGGSSKFTLKVRQQVKKKKKPKKKGAPKPRTAARTGGTG